MARLGLVLLSRPIPGMTGRATNQPLALPSKNSFCRTIPQFLEMTRVHHKHQPLPWIKSTLLSLGDSGFLQFFRVVSSDYGKPRDTIVNKINSSKIRSNFSTKKNHQKNKKLPVTYPFSPSEKKPWHILGDRPIP